MSAIALMPAAVDWRKRVADADVQASDPDASVMRWIPLVVPLMGAAMACVFYLIGYAVLIP